MTVATSTPRTSRKGCSRRAFRRRRSPSRPAERNDLNQPENQDILSPTCRIRVIITKQALQEGWDCPFAYVLCSLSASSNLNAMTQLIGRILRQPGAMKTGIDKLDQCHVITHHANTAEVVEAIKTGLEKDGLGDLVLEVSSDGTTGTGNVARKIKRRKKFSKTDIYLPIVMYVDGDEARELDYETDVLSQIDWCDFDPSGIAANIPKNAQAPESQAQRFYISEDSKKFLVNRTIAESSEILTFDTVYVVRMILDIVPNPFVGREIVGDLISALRKRGFSDTKIGKLHGLIIDELRKGLEAERNARAEENFKRGVKAGRIQFRLRLDGRDWQMPFQMETTEPENAEQLPSKSGGVLEHSLFAPVYKNEMNREEQGVAVHLDGAEAMSWWHRNVARAQYGIQGWRRHKIYPDFIFAVKRDEEGVERVTVLETKGDQLDNQDTDYKRNVLSFLSDNFRGDSVTSAGELELVVEGRTVEGTLILMSDIETKLPEYLKPASPDSAA